MKSLVAALCAVLGVHAVSAGTCVYAFDWFRNNSVSDFPVPIILDEGWLGFSHAACAADGADVRVYDTDGTTPLPHEIESWNVDGKSVLWVKVPSFSRATRLTIAWGADASGVAASSDGLWNDAAAVLHFGETNVSSARNAVNGDELTAFGMTPTRAVSPLGQAAKFDGAGVYRKLDAAPGAYGQITNAFTVSFWLRQTKYTMSNNKAYACQFGCGGQAAVLANWYTGNSLQFWTNAGDATGLWTGGAATRDELKSGAWHHWAITYDGSTHTIYCDGKVVRTDTVSGFTFNPWGVNGNITVGGNRGLDDPFEGEIDEFRLESVCRGADWIRASVETQAQDYPGRRVSIPFSDYNGAALENFPAYIYVDANAGVDPVDFHRALTNGTACVRDARTGARLACEIEYVFTNDFDNSMGFWTRVPRFSAADGVSLEREMPFFYQPEGSGMSIPPSADGVWNEDEFLLVYHMNPTGLLRDVVRGATLSPMCRSTGDGKTALGGYPVAIDGPTGPYQAYHSTTNGLQHSASMNIAHSLTNVHTISWWMKDDADEYANPKRETYVWTCFGMSLLLGPGYSGYGANGYKMVQFSGVGSGAYLTIPDADWHHYAYASDGKNTRTYRDGVQISSISGVKNFNFTSSISGKNFQLMSSSNAAKDAYRGCGDEFRVETVCRSADWLRACYLNQQAWRNGTPWQFAPHFAKGVSATVDADAFTAQATLSCRTNAAVTLCWGAVDGGEDATAWEHVVDCGSCADGAVEACVSSLPAGRRHAYRFCAVNRFGAAWTPVRYAETAPSGIPDYANITVSYAGAETLTNFPLCVRLPASCGLPAEKGLVRFVDAAGHVLAWEAENWNPSGESVVWVRVPELAAGTTLQLQFRSDWEPLDAWTPEEAWPKSEYAGVFHFAAAPSALAKDSTAYASDMISNSLGATNTNGVTGVAVHFPGKIGSGGIYRGDMAGKPLCDYRSGFTFSAWMRILTPPEGDTVQQFWVKQELRSQGDLANGYYMQHVIRYLPSSNRVHFYLYAQLSQFTPPGLSFAKLGLDDCGCNAAATSASSPIETITAITRPDEEWHHYAFVHDGLFLRAYLDGAEVRHAFWPFVLNTGALNHKYMAIEFGSNNAADYHARGALDEFRSERIGRSAAWIKACYDNQRLGSTFVTVGTTIRQGTLIIFR